MGKKEPSFEENLLELEAIVSRMEEGEPTLSELTENYSRGVKLSAKCIKALEGAEKAINLVITGDDGRTEELRLDLEGDLDV